MIGGVVFFEIWFRYFINTTLLVDIHILYAQKWAGGHRCSYRHNVCRPATAVFAILYKIIRKKPAITGSHTNTAICDDNLMRNG